MEHKRENVNSNRENEAKDRLQEDVDRLQRIAEILREMGYTVIDSSISLTMLQNPASESAFPIVREGANCIRACYSKKEGLKIFFTNMLDDPENPTRQHIEKRLKEEGLM